MTREERDKAIRILQWLHDNNFLFRSTEEDVKYATKLAIQALKQEHLFKDMKSKFIRRIKELDERIDELEKGEKNYEPISTSIKQIEGSGGKIYRCYRSETYKTERAVYAGGGGAATGYGDFNNS